MEGEGIFNRCEGTPGYDNKERMVIFILDLHGGLIRSTTKQ